MSAYLNLKYDKAFDVVLTLALDRASTGRQLARAMADGFYGCRRYVIKYNENDGTFSIITDY